MYGCLIYHLHQHLHHLGSMIPTYAAALPLSTCASVRENEEEPRVGVPFPSSTDERKVNNIINFSVRLRPLISAHSRRDLWTLTLDAAVSTPHPPGCCCSHKWDIQGAKMSVKQSYLVRMRGCCPPVSALVKECASIFVQLPALFSDINQLSGVCFFLI